MSYNNCKMRIVHFIYICTVLSVMLLYVNGRSSLALSVAHTWIVTTVDDDMNSNCSPTLYTGTNCEVRDALAQAFAGDTVVLSITGIIKLGVKHTLFLEKNISIIGPGSSKLTIDAGYTPPPTHGQATISFMNSPVFIQFDPYIPFIFIVQPGVDARISGLTLRNGSGISNDHANLTVTNCIIEHNWTARSGGGIDNDHGVLNVEGSTFSDNNANHGDGGGIANNEGTITVANSTFLNNYAHNSGGGINNIYGTISIDNTIFYGNYGKYGGAIGDNGIYILIENSIFSNNTASIDGGGINATDIRLTISNSLISNNTAKFDGGGIVNSSFFVLSNSTIVGNTSHRGGGVFSNYKFYIFSSIIASNNLSSGDIFGPDIYDLRGKPSLADNGFNYVLSLGYNLIGDSTDSDIVSVPSDQIGVYGSRIDPGLMPLLTNAEILQPIILRSDSPAIGKGNCDGNAIVAPSIPPVSTDQRGISRKNPCDIGAYERNDF